jgi:hypothetical protein
VPLPLDRDTLERTIGHNLRTGYAHPCHTSDPKVCAGFAHHVAEHGLHNRLLKTAEHLGIYSPERDLDRVTEFNLGSWEEIVEAHGAAYDNLCQEARKL